jgi:hypothetical protein
MYSQIYNDQKSKLDIQSPNFKLLRRPLIDSMVSIPPDFVQPGGPVRQPCSYSVHSSIDCFKNSSTVLIEFTIPLPPTPSPPPFPFCNSWQNCQLVGWVQGRGSIVQKIAPPPPPHPTISRGDWCNRRKFRKSMPVCAS